MNREKSFLENEIGSALCQQGKFEVALEHFDKAIKLNPENLDALYSKGSCLIELNKVEEGMDYYLKILRISPNDGLTKLIAVLIEYKFGLKRPELNNYLTAQECLITGEQIYSDIIDDDVDEIQKAIALFSKAIELEPAFLQAINYKDIALERIKKINENE